MVERLFLAVPRGCLRFVIVVFHDHTHLLFMRLLAKSMKSRLFKHFFFLKSLFSAVESVQGGTFLCVLY